MRFYSLISSLILSVFLLFISGSESVKTLKKLTVRRGGSLSVPCLYEEIYRSNRKFWCSGEIWISCRIVAYSSTGDTGISVTDHPSQNMFTVDLNYLQDSDSGWYWCAVEISNKLVQDPRDYLYLTVSADPAVWVENSRVSGQEGGSASVQGFYSSEYENKEKKWCRFKDWSCYSFRNSAVKISDDKNRRSFRVEMSGLQKSDAGWYWFSAGGVGVTVHLNVTERPTTTTAATTTAPTTKKTSTHQSISSSRNVTGTMEKDGSTVWALLAVGLVLLLILFSLLTFMLRRTCKRNQAEAKERSSDPAVHMMSTTESTLIYSTVVHDNKKPSSSAADHENNVTYSSVRRSRRNKTSSAAVDRESDVTYSSVRKAPKCKTLSPAVGDDGVIYSSVFHEQEVYANAILQRE